MTASRWKYKQELVTVGENSQTVRQLTAGERTTIMGKRSKLKEGDAEGQANLQRDIVTMAAIDPPVTADEVTSMPTDLLDACAAKVMDLTNGPEGDEKKGPAATA